MPSNSEERTWGEYFSSFLWSDNALPPHKPVDPATLPKNLLLESAVFSEQAYLSMSEARKHPSLKEFLKDQVDGFPVFIQGKGGTDAEAFVWMSKSTRKAVVAYRGTESWDDVFADANIRMTKFPLESNKSVLVHTGFLKQFGSLQDGIGNLLEKNKDKYDSIMSTGHSLGGALATLSAIYYAGKYPTKSHTCVTFGSPRVGEKALAQLFPKLVPTHYRVANENDPVPMVPGNTNYLHVQDALVIPDNLSVYTQADSDEISDRFRLIIGKVDWSRRIAQDHSMALYTNRLKTILDNPKSNP